MRKRIILLVLFVACTLVSCSPKKENLTGDIKLPKPLNEKSFEDSLKLVKLNSNMDVYPEEIKSLGFDRCVLKSEGIRIDSGNFRTDFTKKKNLDRKVSILEENSLPYTIEITSGPGLSDDRNNTSLYTDKDNIVFFSQMLKELIENHNANPNFEGVMLSIGVNGLNKDVYYNTLKEIITRIRETYDVPILITLDSFYFQDEEATLPTEYFKDLDVGFNMEMSFDGKSYPGKVTLNDEEMDLSKNKILSRLLKTKEYNLKNDKNRIIVSVKCPWESGGDILIKDIFEIMHMVDFEFNFSYGNTKDKFDFSLDKNVENTLYKY